MVVRAKHILSTAGSHVLPFADASTKSIQTATRTCTLLGCSTTSTTASTTLPDPPQSVAVRVINDDTLQVTIEPPLNDGGANITHYNITTDIVGPLSFPQTSSHGISFSEQSEKVTVQVPRPLKPTLLLLSEMIFAADGNVTGGIASRTVVPSAPLNGGAFSFSGWVKCSNPNLNYNRIFDVGNLNNVF